MAKHGIVIPKRKTITEAVEHPEKRRKKIAAQVDSFLSNGGKIESIPLGKSGIEFKLFRNRKQVLAESKKFRI